MSKAILLGAMTAFVGTKSVLATEMTRGDYNEYRGWQLPADEVDLKDEQGFLVEYLDGGRSNHDNHKGYISWSPKDVFERSYKPPKLNSNLTFGEAIENLKKGARVARAGWNGKGMWLVLVKPYHDAVHSGDIPCFSYRAFELPYGANGGPAKSPKLLPYIAMKTVGDELVPWLASQTDVLSEDWSVLCDIAKI